MIALLCLIVALLGGVSWLVATAPPTPTHCNSCGTKLHAVPERYGLQLNTTMVLECPRCTVQMEGGK